MPIHPPGFPANYLIKLQQETISNINYNSNDTSMVCTTIHPTDTTDVWGSIQISIPTNYYHPAVHLQAQVMMHQISPQDADHINTDTAAITAYPRTEDSPALLIWQLSCPNNKIPKAAGT
jgi:hypothetical protein